MSLEFRLHFINAILFFEQGFQVMPDYSLSLFQEHYLINKTLMVDNLPTGHTIECELIPHTGIRTQMLILMRNIYKCECGFTPTTYQATKSITAILKYKFEVIERNMKLIIIHKSVSSIKTRIFLSVLMKHIFIAG